MDSALVIGGTRFIGRHLVEELLEHDYDVTLANRGNHENPFVDHPRVDHVTTDRQDRASLEAAADRIDPDAVFDMVAYFPEEVRVATTVFAHVDAYVFVSSGAAYEVGDIPKREDETTLRSCTPEEAVTDSAETYGQRKAEGDREVFTAAEEGVAAMSVRPCVVYGPHDYTERVDYWIDRVGSHDRVLVPGDGTNIWHRVFVEDVASALRIVAERGEPGEAYNVGDRYLVTLDGMIELIAAALETEVEIVHASERELAVADVEPGDFPLYIEDPHVLSTAKLASLGWSSTPLEEAMGITVEEHLESDRDGHERGPVREVADRVLGVLDTL